MSTIKDVLIAHSVDLDTEWGQSLHAALQDREDNLADLLRLAGTQFGLYPEIVAEVLVSVGMGSAPSPEGQALIRQQFVNLMDRLREEHEDGNTPDN